MMKNVKEIVKRIMNVLESDKEIEVTKQSVEAKVIDKKHYPAKAITITASNGLPVSTFSHELYIVTFEYDNLLLNVDSKYLYETLEIGEYHSLYLVTEISRTSRENVIREYLED